MAKTKQQKFTDSLRQSQTNTFSDGLNMDLHPISTPNTIMTDCVNGTMITYNDNEFILQNERGNSKIEGATLSPGFIPIAMKEYGGIIYIVSYNPQTQENEIGTYPSPSQYTTANELEFYTEPVTSGETIKYSEFKPILKDYNRNLIVSNYDKYHLIDQSYLEDKDVNPLILLEHYILDENAQSTKIELTTNQTVRFQHEGNGQLKYLYRPYFISTVTADIEPRKDANFSRLALIATSRDDKLYTSDVDSKYQITIYLCNSDDQIEYKPSNSEFYSGMKVDIDWKQTEMYLEGKNLIPLQFLQEFTSDGKEYIHNKGCIENKNTEDKYTDVKIIITPCIEKNDSNCKILFDNLELEFTKKVSDLFVQPSAFSKFQYQKSESEDNTLSINATLCFASMDKNWYEGKMYDISYESSYKLSEITADGKIIGKSVSKKPTMCHPIVPNGIQTEDNLAIFMPPTGTGEGYTFKINSAEQPVSISNKTELQCTVLLPESTAQYVSYEKHNDEYIIHLLNSDKEEIKAEVLGCSPDLCDLIDEEVNWEEGILNFKIDNVPYEPNKFYIFTLEYTINNKTYNPSFIIITDEKMFDHVNKNRMDEVTLADWFKPERLDLNCIQSKIEYGSNGIENIHNMIPFEELDRIDASSLKDEEKKKYVEELVKKFFLRFQQLHETDSETNIPSLEQSFRLSYRFTTNDDYNYIIKFENANDNKIRKYKKTLSLIPSETIRIKQTTQKKYLWEEFKDQPWETPFKVTSTYGVKIKDGDVSTREVAHTINDYIFMCHEVFWKTSAHSVVATSVTYDYLNTPGWFNGSRKKMDWVNTGKCSNDANKDEIMVWRPSKTGDERQLKFGVSANILYSAGLRSILYSNIKEKSSTIFSATVNHKLWMFGRDTDKIYKLVAINLYGDGTDVTTSKKAWQCILEHGYIIEKLENPKYTYQYKYTENSIDWINHDIVLNDTENLPDKLNMKYYPVQCEVDLLDYEMQSLNNLNPENLSYFEYLLNSYKFEEWKDTYVYFLKYLGKILNANVIQENQLNETIGETVHPKINFDFGDTHTSETKILFSDDGNTHSEPYNLPLNMCFDKTYGIFYLNEFNRDYINTIKHNAGCEWDSIEYTHLKWSYGFGFDKFWNITKDSLENLSSRHSLDFYRSTNYGQQS